MGRTNGTLTMPVECIHPLERLPTTFTLMGSVIEMKLLVALAVMSPMKSFPTSGPLAFERLLFVVWTRVGTDTGAAGCAAEARSTDATIPGWFGRRVRLVTGHCSSRNKVVVESV